MAGEDATPFGWVFDLKAKRFRNAATGRFMSVDTVRVVRETYHDQQGVVMDEVWGDLLGTAGIDTPREDFLGNLLSFLIGDDERLASIPGNSLFEKMIEPTISGEYIFGRGGLNAMTEADWQRLDRIIGEQRGYWNAFVRDALSPNEPLSPKQIRARAQMYLRGSTRAYAEGHASAWAIDLPAYPKDGGTECMSGCRCQWEIKTEKGKTVAYWRLGEAEHCADCVERSEVWNPFRPPEETDWPDDEVEG